MKIIGVGVDIVDNKRIRNAIKNDNFISRIFSKKEISQSKKVKHKVNYYSKRFAAKEAFAKSLGTGFRLNLNFKDIEVLNDKFGKPYYLMSSKIKNIVNKRFKIKRFDLFLSITDEKDYSVAFTILQKK